jgi:hypothetical protein
VEYKQPERYEAIKKVAVSLIRQEIIASSRDRQVTHSDLWQDSDLIIFFNHSLPDMTKQLTDKVVQKTDKSVELVSEGPSRLCGLSSVLVLEIPSNTTPTIHQNAKVMRIDYKIRVTVKIPSADHNGKDKELSVNLPIVIGTTGTSNIDDSGFESSMRSNPFGQYPGGSEGSQSIHNGGDSSIGFRSLSPAPYPPMFGNTTPYPPMSNNGPPAGGFFMPEPFQPYPPVADENRFVLNPQQMPYTSDDSIKIEGMPMPSFDNNQQLVNEIDNAINNSPMSDNQSFMYPPTLGSTRKNPFKNTVQIQQLYPPNTHQDTTISPTTSSPHSPLYGLDHPLNNAMDGLASSISRMSTISSENASSVAAGHVDTTSNLIKPPENVFVHTEKPNTFTPPQTPAAIMETIERPARSKQTASSYYSGVSAFQDSGRETPPPPAASNNHQIATRIDPLLKLAQKDDL